MKFEIVKSEPTLLVFVDGEKRIMTLVCGRTTSFLKIPPRLAISVSASSRMSKWKEMEFQEEGCRLGICG